MGTSEYETVINVIRETLLKHQNENIPMNLLNSNSVFNKVNKLGFVFQPYYYPDWTGCDSTRGDISCKLPLGGQFKHLVIYENFDTAIDIPIIENFIKSSSTKFLDQLSLLDWAKHNGLEDALEDYKNEWVKAHGVNAAYDQSASDKLMEWMRHCRSRQKDIEVQAWKSAGIDDDEDDNKIEFYSVEPCFQTYEEAKMFGEFYDSQECREAFIKYKNKR